MGEYILVGGHGIAPVRCCAMRRRLNVEQAAHPAMQLGEDGVRPAQAHPQGAHSRRWET
jgi:hypothetical protein